MLNEDQQWDNQGAGHVIQQCGAVEGHVMLVNSWQKVVDCRGNGKLLQHSCLENPMNSMKGQKDMTLKDEPPKLVGIQYATME